MVLPFKRMQFRVLSFLTLLVVLIAASPVPQPQVEDAPNSDSGADGVSGINSAVKDILGDLSLTHFNISIVYTDKELSRLLTWRKGACNIFMVWFFALLQLNLISFLQSHVVSYSVMHKPVPADGKQ